MLPKPILTASLLLVAIISHSQTTTVNPQLLTQLKNKVFYLQTSDLDKEPQEIQFRFTYDEKTKSLRLTNVKGGTKGFSFSSSSDNAQNQLILKSVVGDKPQELKFEGKAYTKTPSGKEVEMESEVQIKFDAYNQTKKVYMFCSLRSNFFHYNANVWGWGDIAVTAPKQALTASNTSSGNQSKAATEISNQSTLLKYLENKTFKSSSGTSVKIGYNSEYNTYGVMINNRLMFMNLSYTFLSKYTAVVQGESPFDNGLVKVFVDSKNNVLINSGTNYYYK